MSARGHFALVLLSLFLFGWTKRTMKCEFSLSWVEFHCRFCRGSLFLNPLSLVNIPPFFGIQETSSQIRRRATTAAALLSLMNSLCQQEQGWFQFWLHFMSILSRSCFCLSTLRLCLSFPDLTDKFTKENAFFWNSYHFGCELCKHIVSCLIACDIWEVPRF